MYVPTSATTAAVRITTEDDDRAFDRNRADNESISDTSVNQMTLPMNILPILLAIKWLFTGSAGLFP